MLPLTKPSPNSAGQTLPTGTVTFLFTDIEGSTKLAQQFPDAWESLRQRYNAILNAAMQAHDGYVFQIIGDAFCVAFHTATDALNAAVLAQQLLQQEVWDPAPIKVRIGINSGAAQASAVDERSGGYTGYTTMARVQRVMSVAYGGQILLSNTSAELVRVELSPDVRLLDLKEHRLKGLVNPEHLWQVVASDLPQDFSPLQSLNAIPNNLPIQLTSFVGREKEIVEVNRLLMTTRLLTLTGAGGSGKTRLSLQVAAEVLDTFRHGVWFIELAPLSDPALVPNAIAAVLGLREETGRPLVATVLDYVRNKQLLLILDNCEHLIEACAQFADAVLHASRETRILASSREALGIAGELAWRVPSLPVPNPKDPIPIAQFEQYAAVRLLIERATFALPTFTVTNANAPAMAQICYRLDGIPLAIELAAARVKSLSVEQIAARLDDRFRLLTGGSRTALPRQQTLQATMDWSYELLPDDERTLLNRLAVFVGGWTLEAAESVASDPSPRFASGQAQRRVKGRKQRATRHPSPITREDILDLTTHLVDKSLIILDEQAEGTRYRMLETIRQYGLGKLMEAHEVDRLREQHLAYYLSLAESAEPHFFHPDQLKWYVHIDTELENMRASLEWSQTRTGVESGLRLVMALHRYWYAKQYCREAYDWLQRLISSPHLSRQTRLRGKALFVCGHLQSYFGDRMTASRLCEESLQICRALDYREGIINALWMLGSLHTSQDDGSVLAYFQESLTLAREIGYTFGAMHCLTYYARYELAQGHYESASSLLRECEIEAHKLGGDIDQLGDCRAYLGEIAMLQGDYASASAFLDESMALYQEAGIIEGICSVLMSKGKLALLQGDRQQAAMHYRESLRLRREFTSPRPVATILAYLVLIYAAMNQLLLAARLAGARNALDDGSLSSVAGYEEAVTVIRAKLDEATFNAAWAEGRGMTMEQAINYALEKPMSERQRENEA